MTPFSYTTPGPEGYACARCAAVGCKLWRQSYTMADAVELLCVVCAGHDQEIYTGSVAADGRRTSDTTGFPTDQIGFFLPAIPTEDGEAYWGYTSVPPAARVWWMRLPTRVDRSGKGK